MRLSSVGADDAETPIGCLLFRAPPPRVFGEHIVNANRIAVGSGSRRKVASANAASTCGLMGCEGCVHQLR